MCHLLVARGDLGIWWVELFFFFPYLESHLRFCLASWSSLCAVFSVRGKSLGSNWLNLLFSYLDSIRSRDSNNWWLPLFACRLACFAESTFWWCIINDEWSRGLDFRRESTDQLSGSFVSAEDGWAVSIAVLEDVASCTVGQSLPHRPFPGCF